jgi:hypothetical protein
MLCVNPNPWEGNPFNHNKPKPLGKINHSKPKIFPRNQTQTHTQTRQTPDNHHSFVSPLLLSQQTQRITILSLSRRRPSTPFPSLPIHLFARQPIHRKPKPLHFFQKPNTANPYTTNPNLFFPCYAFSQKSGLLCFFHRNQTKHFVWFL